MNEEAIGMSHHETYVSCMTARLSLKQEKCKKMALHVGLFMSTYMSNKLKLSKTLEISYGKRLTTRAYLPGMVRPFAGIETFLPLNSASYPVLYSSSPSRTRFLKKAVKYYVLSA